MYCRVNQGSLSFAVKKGPINTRSKIVSSNRILLRIPVVSHNESGDTQAKLGDGARSPETACSPHSTVWKPLNQMIL